MTSAPATYGAGLVAALTTLTSALSTTITSSSASLLVRSGSVCGPSTDAWLRMTDGPASAATNPVRVMGSASAGAPGVPPAMPAALVQVTVWSTAEQTQPVPTADT